MKVCHNLNVTVHVKWPVKLLLDTSVLSLLLLFVCTFLHPQFHHELVKVMTVVYICFFSYSAKSLVLHNRRSVYFGLSKCR